MQQSSATQAPCSTKCPHGRSAGTDASSTKATVTKSSSFLVGRGVLEEWNLDDAALVFRPGMHFQNFVLENYLCPVVRPLVPALPSHTIWITQTNRIDPCDNRLVAKALDFHFCARPESFIVNPVLPFVFSSSVASKNVKSHLLRIGVFALHGFIFHFHIDRQSAIADVTLSSAPKVPLNSNPEISNSTWARERPTTDAHLSDHSRQVEQGHDSAQDSNFGFTERRPAWPPHLPKQGSGLQLDSCGHACQREDDIGDHDENGSVKAPLSDIPLNAPGACNATSTATSVLPSIVIAAEP